MKKYLIPFFLLCSTLFLYACRSTDSPHDNTNTQGVPSSDTHTASITEDIQLEMLTSSSGLINSPLAANEIGCYEILLNSDYSANILYTDIATHQRIYLSPSLTADHHSAADPSWFENLRGGGALFCSDQKLYLMHYCTDGEPAILYQSNLDGTNRIKLAIFDQYSPITGAVASDSHHLYCLSNNRQGQCVLLQINSQDGNIKEIAGLENPNAFLISAFDDCIIIKDIIDDPNIETEDALEKYEAQIHRVYKFSLATGKITELIRWKQDTLFEAYSQNKLYGFDMEKDQLILLDMKEETTDILMTSLKEKILSDQQLYNISQIYDNHLIFQTDTEQKALNLNTLEILTIAPTENDYRPFIVSEYEDKFLVSHGFLEVPVADIAPDGTPITTTMLMYKLGTINKEDFWASQYNFTEVKNIFLE